MGELVPLPFRQATLNEKLAHMLADDDREKWIPRGRAFAESADIYSLHDCAAAHIQAVALRRSEERQREVIAFCLFKYFPYGGLQRDFLRIATCVQARGYRIRVYTLSWQGEHPPGFEVIIVPVTTLTNHARYRDFHQWVRAHIEQNPVHRLVGFNKMPDLDVYYAADSCYEEKARTQRSWLYRRLPGYRLFSRFEQVILQLRCH